LPVESRRSRVIVLIAEDNALLAFMMEDALIGGGHTVLGPTGRADAALRLVERTRPDLALIDLELAGEQSGIALARELQNRWNVPTLFATAQTTKAHENSGAALGVLSKPFSPMTVVRAVEVIAELLNGDPERDVPAELELFRVG
jgi:DNA-binding response OmpR family regulator